MKAAIFGTGSVAKRLYQELSTEKGTDYISFFIDSMVRKREFCGKPVYSLENLTTIKLNEYCYYLGSISSQKSMKEELLKLGVLEKNITENYDYSEDAFQTKVLNVKTMLVYPEASDENKEKIEMSFHEYLGEMIDYIKIDYKCNGDIQKYDLILVWNKNRMHDDFILQNNKIFCIDDEFYPTIRARILNRLAYITFGDKKRKEFENKSRAILRKLKNQRAQAVYIFASGPSLERGIQIYQNRYETNTINIVCNGFIKAGKDIIKKVNPKVYLLLDILYLDGSYKELMDEIAKYVKKSECYLIVPNFWIPILVYRYQIDDKIMGIGIDADEIQFLDETKINVYNKAANVITTFGVPIASTLARKVCFIGCDGFTVNRKDEKEKGWQYSKLVSEDIQIDLSQKDMIDYEEKHYTYFDEIINYGEKKGINYHTITESYIPCLKERYSNIV